MGEQDFRVSMEGPVPLPAPEHQRKITRNKWFEIVTVVLMIVIGAGYLSYRNSGGLRPADAVRTLDDAVKTVEETGASKHGQGEGVFGRRIVSFSQAVGIFERRVDLVGTDFGAPLETAIVSLVPLQGEWKPSDTALLDAVNGVGELGHQLVPSSAEALDKAVTTSESITDTPRPHDKGVAATDDGWKVTYVTYRNFDEEADPPQTVLYYVIQRMSAGEDPALGAFNRALYEAILEGDDAKGAVLAAGAIGGS